MRWLIGIDLRALSGGAVAMARWLSARATGNEFYGVHIVESTVPRSALEGQAGAQLEQFRDRSARLLRERLADSLFERLEVREAVSAEDGLGQLVTETGADALIIGRMKPADKTRAVHLGRVARRLLRRLPAPTIVVPPDLDTVPEGPIVLATDLGSASMGAARFARKLATEVDRELQIVHVRRAEDHLDVYMPHEDYVRVVGHAETRARKALKAWTAEAGLGDAKFEILEGHPTMALLEFVRKVDAAIVVTGSRGLSTTQRLFASSTASRVAASIPVAVAVVPADWSVL